MLTIDGISGGLWVGYGEAPHTGWAIECLCFRLVLKAVLLKVLLSYLAFLSVANFSLFKVNLCSES